MLVGLVWRVFFRVDWCVTFSASACLSGHLCYSHMAASCRTGSPHAHTLMPLISSVRLVLFTFCGALWTNADAKKCNYNSKVVFLGARANVRAIRATACLRTRKWSRACVAILSSSASSCELRTCMNRRTATRVVYYFSVIWWLSLLSLLCIIMHEKKNYTSICP